MVMLRPAHNPIVGKLNATRCLLRRQTGSQREPCPPFQNVRTVCDVRTPKRGGVCRSATDSTSFWRPNIADGANILERWTGFALRPCLPAEQAPCGIQFTHDGIMRRSKHYHTSKWLLRSQNLSQRDRLHLVLASEHRRRCEHSGKVDRVRAATLSACGAGTLWHSIYPRWDYVQVEALPYLKVAAAQPESVAARQTPPRFGVRTSQTVRTFWKGCLLYTSPSPRD